MNQRLDIQKLRSQTFFFVEKDPLVDSDFSYLVSEVTSIESPSFESNKMREFVRFCWNKNEYDVLYDHCYQEFVGALSEHILTKYGHLRRSGTMKTDITRDQIFVSRVSNLNNFFLNYIPSSGKIAHKGQPGISIFKH